MKFYLGTHRAAWLARTDVPLFVSRRVMPLRRFPRARGPWALDSGAFTELSTFGLWSLPAEEYAKLVRRYAEEIGGMAWAAPQDWMCEPAILAKTGLTVAEHQRRTVQNFLELRAELGPLVVPVLQGWTAPDYVRCVELYDRAGVRLAAEDIVGLGTVCRRQGTEDAAATIATLSSFGFRIHGFGVKITGLRKIADALASADSMAWSYRARHADRLPECAHRGNCANCMAFALRWRETVLERLEEPRQLRIGGMA